MPQDPEPLYTDAEGIPTLFDVVLPGDVMRRRGFRLPADAETTVAPTGGDDAAALLQRRLREVLQRQLAPIAEQAIRQRVRHP